LKVPLAFANSSIGKKWIVALTGLVMFLFVIGHLAGNLQFFVGPEAINNYGQLLRTSPELLWVIRSFLLLALVLHVVFTLWLVVDNKKAKPQKYLMQASVQVKPSTRLMSISGILLLAFIVFHLAHFTTQNVDPSYTGFHDDKGRHDVFRMMVAGFSNPLYSAFYAVAMVFLCSHLSHGAWSWMQTVGLRTKKVAEPSSRGARILALILMAGYLSIPASVLFGGFGKGYTAERVHAEQGYRQEPTPGTQITPATPAVLPGPTPSPTSSGTAPKPPAIPSAAAPAASQPSSPVGDTPPPPQPAAPAKEGQQP
jgi:succinate dehydrogenase / fumarate reductase cytochrome b subunit